MKKLIVILITSIAFCMTSCDEKHNHLGDLNGNWQLISWVNKDNDSVLADKTSCIYYSISISLLQIHKPTIESKYYLSTFRYSNDSLVLNQAYISPHDSIVQFKDMSEYGVPENGAFKIVELSSDKLTLMSNESILSFRKN